MRTLTVEVDYCLRWSERIEVRVPDDADEAEALDARDRAVAAHEPTDALYHANDAEVEHERWLGDPTFGPPKLDEPPAEAWVQVGEHRWATDGYLAIREDAPRPPRHPMARPWYTDQPNIGGLLATIPARSGCSALLPAQRNLPVGQVRKRAQPLYAAGDVRFVGDTSLVFRGDDLIAMVQLSVTERRGPSEVVRIDGGLAEVTP